MAGWTTYRGLQVPDVPTGQAGIYLKSDLTTLADRDVFSSSSNPTVTSDLASNYSVGSLWFNSTTQTFWVCTDNAAGSAKWRSLFKRVDNALVLAPDAGVGAGSDGRALQFDDSGDSRGVNAVDLQRTRTASTQVAAGTNAGIFAGENNTAFSRDSVVAGGKSNNAGGKSGTITGISVASPTVITTSSAHGLVAGQTIEITGSNSTPSIDGVKTVSNPTSTTFKVAVNVTGSGNAGTWTTASQAPYAFVAGGTGNRAVGKAAHAQGRSATAAGYAAHSEGNFTVASAFASHAEGNNCTASGSASHAEGYWTSASGQRSHSEGSYCTASGLSSHVEGYQCTASSTYAHAEGSYCSASEHSAHAEGRSTSASAQGAHSGGVRAHARLLGQFAQSSGGHSSQVGSAQSTTTVLLRATSNATATELTLGGGSPSGSTRFVLVDGQTLSCLINIVGRKVNPGANDHASFVRLVCIQREGTTTQLVGSVQTLGTDVNPAGWGGVTISADDTNESLKVEVTGAASTTIRWVATVYATEVADSTA